MGTHVLMFVTEVAGLIFVEAMRKERREGRKTTVVEWAAQPCGEAVGPRKEQGGREGGKN